MNKKDATAQTAAAIIILITAGLLLLPIISLAGDIEPISGPEDNNTAMYTLDDIRNQLETGTTGAKRQGSFSGPANPPASSGATLNDLQALLPAPDIDGVWSWEVAEGKTYWSLKYGEWGLQTGTATNAETCGGTLVGTRWCDQEDGTVKDMTTGLVWLQDASWGGQHPYFPTAVGGSCAHDRAAFLTAATNPALTDGSVEGDWRLPTFYDMLSLFNGEERVTIFSQRAFSGISTLYWTSTFHRIEWHDSVPWTYAITLSMTDGGAASPRTDTNVSIWPVRGKNRGADYYDYCEESGCYEPECGDGLLAKWFEQCDDGNKENGDGCTDDCKCEDLYDINKGCYSYTPECGDGIVNPGEECDDGANGVESDGCNDFCICSASKEYCEEMHSEGLRYCKEEVWPQNMRYYPAVFDWKHTCEREVCGISIQVCKNMCRYEDINGEWVIDEDCSVDCDNKYSQCMPECIIAQEEQKYCLTDADSMYYNCLRTQCFKLPDGN